MIYFSHGGVRLRVPSEKDLPLIQQLRNSHDTWSHLTDPRPIGPSDQKAWIESLGLRAGRYAFAVEADKIEFAGFVRMDEHDLVHRSLRVGADVVAELRNRGIGTRIYRAVMTLAFNNLNVHRLWLQVLPSNPARRLYERLGFVEEGRLREAVFRDGRYEDYILMSLLEPEYRK